MNNQWTTQRGQLDQALDLERALRQARRRQQPSVWQVLWQKRAGAWQWLAGRRRAPVHTALRATLPQG
ncbi:MAG: hypothetical protein DYG89_35435 [Caldilinea sp. CFX5]|nr:hypothetical protein [Caldilinea sp. CFX5]